MADDTSKRGAGDRSKVAGEQPYEIGYFAEKHGISRKEAQALIDRIGNDRTKLDAAAAQRSTPPASRRNRASRATTRTSTADHRSPGDEAFSEKAARCDCGDRREANGGDHHASRQSCRTG